MDFDDTDRTLWGQTLAIWDGTGGSDLGVDVYFSGGTSAPSITSPWVTTSDARPVMLRIAQIKASDSFTNLPYRKITKSSTNYFNVIKPSSSASRYRRIVSNTVNCDHDYTAPPPRDKVVTIGEEFQVKLPDGSRLEVAKDGSFQLLDADAKITYKANRCREFNAFINAADKLEDFIKFCGEVGVRKGEMLRLPLELFVSWLIIAAAKQDGEDGDPEVPVPLLPSLRRTVRPHCTSCGRFLSRMKQQRRIGYCAPRCFETHYARAMVSG